MPIIHMLFLLLFASRRQASLNVTLYYCDAEPTSKDHQGGLSYLSPYLFFDTYLIHSFYIHLIEETT